MKVYTQSKAGQSLPPGVVPMNRPLTAAFSLFFGITMLIPTAGYAEDKEKNPDEIGNRDVG